MESIQQGVQHNGVLPRTRSEPWGSPSPRHGRGQQSGTPRECRKLVYGNRCDGGDNGNRADQRAEEAGRSTLSSAAHGYVGRPDDGRAEKGAVHENGLPGQAINTAQTWGQAAPCGKDEQRDLEDKEDVPGLVADSSDDEEARPPYHLHDQGEESSDSESDAVWAEMNMRALAWRYGARTAPPKPYGQSGTRRGEDCNRNGSHIGKCCAWDCTGHQRWAKRPHHAAEEDVAEETAVGRDGTNSSGDMWASEAGTTQMGHRRIGEAQNPGPARASDITQCGIPWSEARPQDALKYPAPHRPGFRDVLTQVSKGRTQVPRCKARMMY